MATDSTVRFVVVAPEPSLEDEFQSALDGLKGRRCVVNFVDDARAGIEAARVRQPDVVVIELGENVTELKAFGEEVGIVSPDSAVVAVYRREIFRDAEAESNVIIDALRSRVTDFLRRPISTGELDSIVGRVGSTTNRAHRGGAELGRVISFVSNKGGVGKSTISTNVACELARRHPGEVFLLDLSLQLGVCASMLDLDATQTITDAAQQLERLDTTLLQQMAIPHRTGLRVLPAPPTVMAAAEVDERVVSRVLSLARRVYKYVVVDTFPVVDGVVMSVLDVSNVICIITQVMVPILNGTASLLETMGHLGLDEERIWILLNRAHPRFAGELRLEDVEAHLGFGVRHEIGYDRKIPMSVNMGRPHVIHGSHLSRFKRSVRTLVDDIEAHTGDTPAGAAGAAARERTRSSGGSER